MPLGIPGLVAGSSNLAGGRFPLVTAPAVLQFQHPPRHFASRRPDHVRDRAQVLSVLLRVQRQCLACAACAGQWGSVTVSAVMQTDAQQKKQDVEDARQDLERVALSIKGRSLHLEWYLL